MTTSLILPCYNPPPGWEQQVYASYTSFCTLIKEQTELVIVIDGRSDKVTEKAKSFLSEKIPQLHWVFYPENHGKGYALRQGIAIAAGDVLMYTDIDFPYTIESMQAVHQALSRNELDVAIGVKDEAYYSHVPFFRKAISRWLRFMISVFLSMPVTDTQCGLKGFRKNVAPLFLRTKIDRYLFDLEFVYSCFKIKKYRVAAIPVALKDNVQFRSMNYRILIPEMANFIRLLFNSHK